MLLPVMVAFAALLQASILTPVSASKPKPMELKISCTAFNPAEHQDTEIDHMPIILLHGLSGNKESFHDTYELLALETKKEVCIADLRNHGESPWNNEEYDVEAMTEDIKHLIDKLKAPKAIVLGHSMGGKIAVHLALTYPERIEKIIVEDMRPNGMTTEAVEEVKFVAKLLGELQDKIPQGVTEIESKKGLLKIINERLGQTGSSIKLEDPSILPIRCVDGKCSYNSNPVLFETFLRNYEELWNESSGRFDGGALFIYGGKSSFKVRDDEDNIKRLFPNAKLVEVEEAGHIVYTFKKFMTEVVKFINNQ